jgi:hypothetical protein
MRVICEHEIDIIGNHKAYNFSGLFQTTYAKENDQDVWYMECKKLL